MADATAHSLACDAIAAVDITIQAAGFFLQAEDGIRDKLVTGVQTCALPICLSRSYRGTRVPGGHQLGQPGPFPGPPPRHFTSAGLRCLMVRDMTEDPFEAVVAAHHSEIHRYLVRATSRPGDADDLSQETFVRAYRAYRALPPDANVRAWLFAIATNL